VVASQPVSDVTSLGFPRDCGIPAFWITNAVELFQNANRLKRLLQPVFFLIQKPTSIPLVRFHLRNQEVEARIASAVVVAIDNEYLFKLTSSIQRSAEAMVLSKS
jgi:hypothetical protein